MSSLFDMNQPTRVCPICVLLHPPTTPCKYDNLVKMIWTMKENLRSVMLANKEAVETAQAFQKIIRDLTPETERLVAIEVEYRKLVNGLKGAPVHSFVPSKDPTKPSPLVGVSADVINELLPPDIDDKVSFEAWLMKRHSLAYHACNTGDCDHAAQVQCDETLKNEN